MNCTVTEGRDFKNEMPAIACTVNPLPKNKNKNITKNDTL